MKVNKRGQLATGLVAGIIGFVFLFVIGFVMLNQLNSSGLLTTNSAEYNASTNLTSNLATGAQTIAIKIPTFFTIITAVVLIGFVLLLWRLYQNSKLSGGSSGTGL